MKPHAGNPAAGFPRVKRSARPPLRTGIALGSNLGDRLGRIKAACAAIRHLPGVSGPVVASPIYETEPVQTEPDAGTFLNAVLEIGYSGLPATLLERLQEIEAQLGRPSRRPRNASRIIDLDLLYVGNLVLCNSEAVIPHPRLHLRRFVLAPLADIRPDLLLPGREETVAELFAELGDPADVRLFQKEWTP